MSVRKTLNQLRGTIKKGVCKKKAVSLLKYEEYVKELIDGSERKKIWTDALQKALIENGHIYIPSGIYYIDNSVIVPSDRTITAHKKAEICLLKDTGVVMLRNQDVIDGSYRAIKADEPRSKNIMIRGGVWSTEFDKRGEYGKVGAFDREDSLHGVHAIMLFSGVDGLWLKNMIFKKAPCFAVQIGRAKNFIVEGLRFQQCFADGVHLNGDLYGGVVINIVGETGDDLVAMNAYDWANSTINNGAMENITVANVKSVGKEFHLMRLLPGVMPADKGGMDCYMKNIHICNIKGVNVFKLYLQTPSYIDVPDGTNVGRMENITFENLKIVKDGPSDSMANYKDKNLITGHFGVFELGSNIKQLTLKNITVTLNTELYPDTAHLITVGPKSAYIEERKIEIFDPYVSCVVDEIAFKNIRINGKVVTDLRTEIKEISFGELYLSSYPFGTGKVEHITLL